ncbi:hypothetical protein [Atlantibacter subterraneus]|uniref:baseplate complex protein n=1 Tax=Atlantibacter subterraneus TaxID=255519 RepID=UPI002FDD7B5E
MTKIVILALDGEAIPLKEMKVTATQQFQEKDQSGQTSSTARAEQGIKAKELRISGVIPFSKPEILRRVFELGTATTSDGKMKVYRVANMTAQAIGFREATFSGQIDAPQLDGKMAWLVTFTLREFISVPEKKQARSDGKISSKVQGQAGGANATDGADESQKLSWFERNVLKPTDEALGKVVGGGNASA